MVVIAVGGKKAARGSQHPAAFPRLSTPFRMREDAGKLQGEGQRVGGEAQTELHGSKAVSNSASEPTPKLQISWAISLQAWELQLFREAPV